MTLCSIKCLVLSETIYDIYDYIVENINPDKGRISIMYDDMTNIIIGDYSNPAIICDDKWVLKDGTQGWND